MSDAMRIHLAGEGEAPTDQLIARIFVSLDEYIADEAGGDPARTVTALRSKGLDYTADVLDGLIRSVGGAA